MGEPPARYVVVVLGKPEPMGSKRIGRRKDGRPLILDNKDAALRSWQTAVRLSLAANRPEKPLNEPVKVSICCFFGRPASHYGTGRNRGQLKRSAPLHHQGKPDADKLARAALDCLTGNWIVDDCRVVELAVTKLYAEEHPEQTVIVMEPLGRREAAGEESNL